MARTEPLTLVLGLGESGLAMGRWLARRGVPVRVADSRETPPGVDRLRADAPAAEIHTGPFSDALLDGVGRIAISPGLDPRQPLVESARARGIPVTGEMELLVEALRDLGVREQTRIIAITGTNGKTTTTTLVGEMVLAAGLDGVVAGNISPAALDVLMARQDAGAALPAVWVLELSSFQLDEAKGFEPDAATVLNITEDHLDWHGSMAAYAAAKARVFGPATAAGTMVINRDDPLVEAMDIVGPRPVDQRGNARIQPEEAIVGRARRGLVFQGRPEDRVVSLREHHPHLLVVLEHERFGLEALPRHGRRIVAEERIVGGSTTDDVLHLLPALLERLGRQHADPHVEGAPRGHRACPVSAGDLADVEVHRVMVGVKVGILRLLLVPLLLQLAQGTGKKQRTDPVRHRDQGAGRATQGVARLMRGNNWGNKAGAPTQEVSIHAACSSMCGPRSGTI